MNDASEEDVEEKMCFWIAKVMPSRANQVFTWYFFIAIVNILLAVTASCGNILILIALQKELPLSGQTRVLFRSLATSDVCVGLVSQPLFAASILLIGHERRWDICRFMRYFTYVISTTLCGVSLLTLTAISVDRLLVLLLEFNYGTIVTQVRMKAAIACFWIISVTISMVYLKSRRIFFLVTAVVIILSVTISVCSYFTIFLILRRRQNRIGDNEHQINLRLRQKRSQRIKRTVYGVLWVHFALVVCYLPFSVVEVMSAKTGTTLPTFVAGTCLATLIYFNSTINPFLYCWRIRDVRRAVKRVFS